MFGFQIIQSVNYLFCVGPVSYTHLDVYKRQIKCYIFGILILLPFLGGFNMSHSAVQQEILPQNFMSEIWLSRHLALETQQWQKRYAHFNKIIVHYCQLLTSAVIKLRIAKISGRYFASKSLTYTRILGHNSKVKNLKETGSIIWKKVDDLKRVGYKLLKKIIGSLKDQDGT